MASAGGAAQEPDIFDIGNVIDETYVISARLGKGGYGEIYRATSIKDGSVVAVKVERSSKSGNLFEELGILNTLTCTYSHNIRCRTPLYKPSPASFLKSLKSLFNFTYFSPYFNEILRNCGYFVLPLVSSNFISYLSQMEAELFDIIVFQDRLKKSINCTRECNEISTLGL